MGAKLQWIRQRIAPWHSALLISIGILAITVYFSWGRTQEVFRLPAIGNPPTGVLWPGLVSLIIGAWLGHFVLKDLKASEPKPDAVDYSKVMYGRYLVGISFVLLISAMVNVVAVAGFARIGVLRLLFNSYTGPDSGTESPDSQNQPRNSKATIPSPSPNPVVANKSSTQTSISNLSVTITNTPSTQEPRNTTARFGPTNVTDSNRHSGAISESAVRIISEIESGPYIGNGYEPVMPLKTIQEQLITCMQILFALGFAVTGTLFYFAKSLWNKMEAIQTPAVPVGAQQPEQFDERKFWAGLWFRLGSSVVFTLVILIALLFYNKAKAPGWLPFIAIVIGLNVKAAEEMIMGVVTRLLAAVKGFIG